MGRLEEFDVPVIFGSLAERIFDDFEELSIYFNKTVGSAFNCVITAPFSRQVSKKCHQSYLFNKKLFVEKLRKYLV